MGGRNLRLSLLFVCLMAEAATPAASIKVSPSTTDVRIDTTKTFTAAVSGVTGQIQWRVLSTGATSTGSLGTVTSAGVYTPPDVVPTPNTVYVRAVDPVNAATYGQATVTLLNPTPVIAALTPNVINTGLPYKIVISGTGFLPTSQVQWDDKTVPSKFISATEIDLQGSSLLTGGTTVQVTVVNPDPGTKASYARTLTVQAPVQVTLTPDGRTLRCGLTLQLSPKVANNSDKTVTWLVGGKANGDATVGTVDANSVYTAPLILPASPAVTIIAASKADPSAKATITVTLQNPQPIISAVTPATVYVGPINLMISGIGFAKNATVLVSGKALKTTWVSDKSLTATGAIEAQLGRTASVKVTNPDPGTLTSAAMSLQVNATPAEMMTYANAVRFLEMASWGATPASVAHLQTIGRDEWLKEQFAAPPSALSDPTDMNQGAGALQQAFLTNALIGNDQLRQRVAFALSQIFVVSATKDTQYWQMVPYLRLLSTDAFGNFRTLLEAVTLNPGMGLFLDMVNNAKANPAKGTVANENYGREVMQLFTIGINPLNLDGTVAAGPPAYDQTTVTELAKVFTGWTYAPTPGFSSQWKNPAYYFAPMIAFEAYHDTTVKTLNFTSTAGPCTIPGLSAAADLKIALDCLANHPNVAPFISYRLIQHLVMSNPSPNYVRNVATVFNSSHGNLQAVVMAILTDPEATAANSGKLLEPVLYATTVLRALNANVLNGVVTGLAGQTEAMGQKVLYAPSVFNYFSPFYRIPGMTPPPIAPEFQLVNAATALARVNYVYRVVNNQVSGNIRVDLTTLQDLAADADKLIEAVNQALYRGTMAAGEKTAIKAAVTASADARTRVLTALYVAAAAPQYQVQY